MATYINTNVKFHGFSKSPVRPDTTLGNAVNPSGHTITTSQIRSQDIPAFLNTFQSDKEQALAWLASNYTTPAHNDIVYYGGEFKEGFGKPGCLKYNAKAETPAWEDFGITAAATLKNADDKDVIAVHQNCATVFVNGTNNAATNSNRWSLFVKKSDNTILDHFVASTDKIVAGMPSLGYNALVMYKKPGASEKTAIDEGELNDNYIGNTFAGIVHLNRQYATGDDANFAVTCFEYIGEKLNDILSPALSKPDGSVEEKDENGNTIITRPDGTVEETDKEGNTTITKPDGTVEETDKEGNTTTTKPDGTVEETDKEGNTTITRPDGTVEETDKEGNTTITRPDGTVEETDKEGNTTITKPIPGIDDNIDIEIVIKPGDGTTDDGPIFIVPPDDSTEDSDGNIIIVLPGGGEIKIDPANGTVYDKDGEIIGNIFDNSYIPDNNDKPVEDDGHGGNTNWGDSDINNALLPIQQRVKNLENKAINTISAHRIEGCDPSKPEYYIKAVKSGNTVKLELGLEDVITDTAFKAPTGIAVKSYVDEQTENVKNEFKRFVVNEIDETAKKIDAELNENIDAVTQAVIAVKADLVNHVDDTDIHITDSERTEWNSAYEKTENLVTSLDDSSNIPASSAVKSYVDSNLLDPTVYLFPELSKEERKYYMIYDAWGNPAYMNFANELTDGYGLFRFRKWHKFHIDMPNLINAYRMFHSNTYLESFKSNMHSVQSLDATFNACYNLKYFDVDLSSLQTIDAAAQGATFGNCYNLTSIKVAISSKDVVKNFLNAINGIDESKRNKNITDKKLMLGYIEDGEFVSWNESEIECDSLTELKKKGWKLN